MHSMSPYCSSPDHIQTVEVIGVICPNWHVLDNKTPEEFKQVIHDNGCKIELTLADMYWQNEAEQAVQTFKSYFIALLYGIVDDFPLVGWTHSTDMTHTESSPTVKHCAKHFILCISSWGVPLQLNAPHTYGLCSTIPHQTNTMTNMGQTFQQWMLPPYLTRALPRQYCIFESNMQYMHH